MITGVRSARNSTTQGLRSPTQALRSPTRGLNKGWVGPGACSPEIYFIIGRSKMASTAHEAHNTFNCAQK